MNKLNISIPSSVDNIHMLENFIESFTTAFSLPDNLSARISLPMNEAYTNCIRYGNGEDVTKMITVYAEKVDNQLKVTISDEGKGFDYTIIPDPTSEENIEKGSKRGLFQMKQLSDELIFENNGATVIMKFNLPIDNRRTILLKYLRSIKPSELIKDASTVKQLEISIPCERSHFIEIEDFVYRLLSQLNLRGILFYRIAVVTLEVVKWILDDADKSEAWNPKLDMSKYNIKIVVKKMTTQIKVTIVCEDMYPCPLRHYHNFPYSLENYPNKISFVEEENEMVLIFSRWTKKNRQRYL